MELALTAIGTVGALAALGAVWRLCRSLDRLADVVGRSRDAVAHEVAEAIVDAEDKEPDEYRHPQLG